MASNLKSYLEDKNKTKFNWETNNCMSFAFGFLDIEDLPERLFLGNKTQRACYKAYIRECKRLGYLSLPDALDSLMERVITLHPRDGWVVVRNSEGLIGYSCGLVFRGSLYFMSEEGMVSLEPMPGDVYWK